MCYYLSCCEISIINMCLTTFNLVTLVIFCLHYFVTFVLDKRFLLVLRVIRTCVKCSSLSQNVQTEQTYIDANTVKK